MSHDTSIRKRWGHLGHFRQTGREYKSECPRCGGAGIRSGNKRGTKSDRFHIHLPDSRCDFIRGVCRQCGHVEAISVSTAPMTAVQKIKSDLIKSQARDKVDKRIQKRLSEIQKPSYYRSFHDQMTDSQRSIWTAIGISPENQDWFCLGYNMGKRFKVNGELLESDALTIPHMRFLNDEMKPVNISYRLLCSRDIHQGGKYRYEWGVPSQMFIAEPDKPLTGHVLVVEGAKKGIICWLHLATYFDHVIGLPTSHISPSWADDLQSFDRITLMLDPDTHEPDKKNRSYIPVREAAKRLKAKEVCIAVSPEGMKPDDFLLKYSGSSYLERGSSLLMSAVDAAELYH